MEGEGVGRLGEAGEQAVVEHRLGALAGLLGGLEDHHQGARPLALHRRQPPRGAEPGGHVGVVAAGVHHPALDPGDAGRPDLAGEGQAGLLDHRQGVHVGAHQQHRAGAVPHHRDDAGPADSGRHLEAELPRLRGQLRRRSSPPAC